MVTDVVSDGARNFTLPASIAEPWAGNITTIGIDGCEQLLFQRQRLGNDVKPFRLGGTLNVEHGSVRCEPWAYRCDVHNGHFCWNAVVGIFVTTTRVPLMEMSSTVWM